MTPDPYAALGVVADASEEDIKRAYRRLVRRVHPDVNPGREQAATEQLVALNAAYDEALRAMRSRPPRYRYQPYGIPAVPRQRFARAWYA